MKRYTDEDRYAPLGAFLSCDRLYFKTMVSLRGAAESCPVVYRRGPVSELFNSNLLDLRRLKKPKALAAALEPAYTPAPGERTLVFESRFESGNLAMASKKSDSEYNLLLQNDTNSKGNTQWFYFKVSNTAAKETVRFSILNLGKGGSLFCSGMKVLVLSERMHEFLGVGWQRGCDNIQYAENGIRKEGTGKSYHTLSFSFTFPYSDDTVSFSYAHPYTYSDLIEDLNAIELHPFRSQFVTRRELCATLMGNRCEIITITAASPPDRAKVKKGVVLSARVHPGETVSSWMMKGLLDFLTGPEPEAQLLRESYVFKVIPMLNPDGVIHGNYRCGLAGADLNRRWRAPSKTLHPTVFHAKRMIKAFARERPFELLCDLHGHSRRKNVFIYGNPSPDPAASRLLPYILSQVSPFFSYPGCSFHLQTYKESTQRITMFRELKIPAIYTMEATFSGMSFGPHAGQHLTTEQLQQVGKHLALALLLYGGLMPPQHPLSEAGSPGPEDQHSSIAHFSREQFVQQLTTNKELLETACGEGGSSGSESSPSEDNLDPEELAQLLPAVPRPKGERAKKRLTRDPSALRSRSFKEDAKTVKEKEAKDASPKKCTSCGLPQEPGHICPRPKVLRPLPSSFSRLYTKRVGLNTYVSPSGKKVHDQATQTPRPVQQDVRARSLPPSVASTRDSMASMHNTKEGFDLRISSPDKRLPAIPKITTRELSAPAKHRR